MVTRPIKRFIDIEIKKDTPKVSAAGFSTLLCLTTSATLVERVKSFSSVEAVHDFFGDGEEHDFAAAFFAQDPFKNVPEKILFGKHDDTGSETIEEAIVAIEAINNDWYAIGAIKTMRDTQLGKDIATAIESRRKMFILATNDENTLTTGDTTTISYWLKQQNYKRTIMIYLDATLLPIYYPDASWAGQQFSKPVGNTNWAFKTLGGVEFGGLENIPPSNLTIDQIDACYAVNCNVYTTTLSADFTHPGITTGGKNADSDGEYIDIIRNIDFLQARVEEGLLSLLLEKEIIPMTNGGITICENRLLSLLDTYGVKQGILIDGSVKVSFPKRSEISQTDRDDRLLPSGTFTADLTGGINKVIVRGTVSI
jgi:hypothetical protein